MNSQRPNVAVVAALSAIALSIAACGSPGSPSGGDAAGGNGSTDRSAPSPAAGIAFTEVTERAGLGDFRHRTGERGDKWMPESMGSGAGFIDYDEDGRPDVLLVGGGIWEESQAPSFRPVRLYRNEGDGTFTEVTEEAGLGGVEAYAFGVAVGDYDEDGDSDFLLTTLRENLLFENRDGRFVEVGEEAGIADHAAWSSSALFFDTDRDGDLDLLVGNYVRWSPETDVYCSMNGQKAYCTPEEYEGVRARFYENDGDGTFTNRTEDAGFTEGPGKNLGVVDLDYDRDGRPDLMIANDVERNLLYRNRGDGTFEEVGLRAGVAFDENGGARAGMGIDAGVVDSTGQSTVFVGNFSNEMIGVFRHGGNGLFDNRAAVSRIGRPSLPILTFGLFLFDVEYDADLDLFVANGHMQPEVANLDNGIDYRQPTQLFVNRENGLFVDVVPELGPPLARPIVGRGAAHADYDGDGDLDVLVTENGGPAHLYRNDSETGSYLRVDLVGTESNRSAIGAEVIARVGDRTLRRRRKGGSSYLSQSEKIVSFGLGDRSGVDSLRVEWPSGRTARYGPIQGGRTIRITEGAAALEEVATDSPVAER